MLKKFVYMINDFPLAGKLSIRPFAYYCWNATTVPKRIRWFSGLMFILVFFIIVHGRQALLGFNSFNFGNQILLNTVFISYGLVNLLASIAQVHLLIRAIKFMFKKKLPKTKRKYVQMEGKLMLLCILVTLLGQIVFLAAMYLS